MQTTNSMYESISSKNNCDNEFLSLLSTQREILKKLNREKQSMEYENGDRLQSVGRVKELSTNFTPACIEPRQLPDSSDPFFLMNEPIIERQCQAGLLNKVKDQKYSSFDIISSHASSQATDSIDNTRNHRRTKIVAKNCFQMNGPNCGRRAQHNNQLYGMLANALVLDVDSTMTKRPIGHNFQGARRSLNRVHKNTQKLLLGQNIDLATLRGEFEKFVVAMEKSMKSQQDIHNWDRMMGLKRSHSKTMRLSMRSRNKLRKVIKV